jgi:peptide-methionine (S)-S-oxide reductase
MTRTLKLGLIAAAAVGAVALPAAVTMRNTDQASTKVPAAARIAPATGNRQVAVLAGGCFWGVEAVFEHVKGVIDVRSGYAGRSDDVNYGNVGKSGSAEAVRIIFDPKQVNYSDLLRIFFAVAHDPTEVNRQGPDVGPQYRSAIFPQSPVDGKWVV